MPHLLTDGEILQALREMRRCTAPGGICLVSIRDYDAMDLRSARLQPYGVREADGARWVLFQVWDPRPPLYETSLYVVEDRGGTADTFLAAGLVPLTVAPFAAGSLNPTLDAILCSVLLLHSHMGFQQVVIDYIPSRTYPGLRKTFNWLLNIATVLVGVGLYEFETNDVGITEAVRRVWKA